MEQRWNLCASQWSVKTFLCEVYASQWSFEESLVSFGNLKDVSISRT